jgi:hypothetical protein
MNRLATGVAQSFRQQRRKLSVDEKQQIYSAAIMGWSA